MNSANPTDEVDADISSIGVVNGASNLRHIRPQITLIPVT